MSQQESKEKDSKRNPDEFASPHFRVKELACPCCGLFNMPAHMLGFLERVRQRANVAMVITSACRCPKRNKQVGGAAQSQHLKGLAVDIHCAEPRWRMVFARAAFLEGALGIGLAETFVHIDIGERAYPVLWLY